MDTPIRTLGELVDVVQELIDSTGKHVYAEDLQAALYRVDATANGWRPIETAPTDERVVVVLKPRPFETEGEITFGYRVQEVWTRDETGEAIMPTHWMPLPARPAPNAGEPDGS